MIFKILNKLFGVKKRFVIIEKEVYQYKTAIVYERDVYLRYLIFDEKSQMKDWLVIDWRRKCESHFYYRDLSDVLAAIASRRRNAKND
jgi:hypothetical protein